MSSNNKHNEEAIQQAEASDQLVHTEASTERTFTNTKASDENLATSKSKGKSSQSTTPPKNLIRKDSKQLKEFISHRRKAMASEGGDISVDSIRNDYEKAESCGKLIRKQTGVIFDDQMELHNCPWDLNYAENPKRYRVVLNRCRQIGLMDRCLQLPYCPATQDQIVKLHSSWLYEKLNQICQKTNIEEMEDEASCYDSVYFHQQTLNAALIATGAAISLVKAVCDGTVQNGMAIIRPPGHHAMKDEFCGYCYFNNVAIAAQYALDNKLAKKILIVDVDVHHGQATQQMFYNDNRVLYFSIHRYENGLFWPNLRESSFDYIGEGNGKGFNINFPLNATGLEDSDYLTIVTHILLPVAYEYQPDLVIVSAGYDACVGCTEGEMEVSPGFYGHLIMLLSGLACSKIAVCLEGGYFLPSLAEGAAMTLKSLLGDPPAMLAPLSQPHFTVTDMINNLKSVLCEHWNCFRVYNKYSDKEHDDTFIAIIKYFGEPCAPPYPTRNCYPTHSEELVQQLTTLVSELQVEYQSLGINQRVACCYDEEMLLHNSKSTHNVVETPERLLATYELYKEWGLDKRCVNIEPTKVALETITQVHNTFYVMEILRKHFKFLIKNETDMFYNDGTLNAVMKAVDCLNAVVDSVMNGNTQSGVALIRPPGHHAGTEAPSGYCYLNNVAIAAQYLIDVYKLSRILILDFDIHHGNGTQNIFYKNEKVLYVSIHKFDPEKFFPKSQEGDCNYCGADSGKGFNVNIAVNSDKLHDVDYIAIFHRLILPIAYSFAPEIVLVSAGFDAGINDRLGHYAVTPECFGHFVQLLKPLANGKIILALEGGYNTTTVKYGMNICIKTLLGDPLPPLDLQPDTVSDACNKVIQKVMEVQQHHWPILNTDKKLSIQPPKLIIKPVQSTPVETDRFAYLENKFQKEGRLAKRLKQLNSTTNTDSSEPALPSVIEKPNVSTSQNTTQ